MNSNKKITANLITATAEVVCDWCLYEVDEERYHFEEVTVTGGKCARCAQPFTCLWLSYGRREREESTTKYVVFRIADLAEAGVDVTDNGAIAEAAINGSGFCRYYRGPGRAFGAEPMAHVSRSRVLVTQFCSMDI